MKLTFTVLLIVALVGGIVFAQNGADVTERLRRLSRDAAAIAASVGAPLPPVYPAHVVASTNTPIPRNKLRIDHPSGMTLEITMPTNQYILVIPDGYVLEKLHVSSVSFDAFADIKRTNTGAAIFYFVPAPQ
jgi:hypothetical protein